MVIDDRYKKYDERVVDIEDNRQISGYARMEGVYKTLNLPENQNIPCLIVFPDLTKGVNDFQDSDFSLAMEKIPDYTELYKLGVTLPQL